MNKKLNKYTENLDKLSSTYCVERKQLLDNFYDKSKLLDDKYKKELLIKKEGETELTHWLYETFGYILNEKGDYFRVNKGLNCPIVDVDCMRNIGYMEEWDFCKLTIPRSYIFQKLTDELKHKFEAPEGGVWEFEDD